MTPAAFKQSFPAFADVPDAVIEQTLNKGAQHFSIQRWGPFYEEGLGLWAANHLALQTEETKGVAQVHTDYTLGRLKLKQDATLALRQLLNPSLRTIYGQKLYALKQIIGLGMLVV